MVAAMEGPSADRDFATFYDRVFDRVAGAVRGHAGADADDVAQEALVVARQDWDRVATLDRPDAWVRRVAVRMAARRAWRERERQRREALIPRPVLVSYPDVDLRAAIQSLPERHAAAIRLHHLEDRPVHVVAARLGCTEAAAKVLLHRARRLLAERLSGLSGRWVAERLWTPDTIVRHLGAIGAAAAVGPVLDEDLGGRGGRFELTIRDGSYQLVRDDERRFDHGTSRVIGAALELAPTLNVGRARYRPSVDGTRLSLRLVDTTTPPTRGVADEVWISLLLESTTFVNADRQRPGL